MKPNLSLLKYSKQIVGSLAMALLLPAVSHAAGWNIDPLRVDLTNNKKTAAITITNDSTAPTTIQIQPIAWSQVEGKEIYTPTKDLLVSPPIVTIAPKTSQIIRLALRKVADPTKELSYRINLQEIATTNADNVSGVQVALRIGIPVFVQPLSGKSQPKLSWKVGLVADNMIKLELRNEGTAHVKITDLVLSSVGQEQAIANEIGSSYILPDQAHVWFLKPSMTENFANGHFHLKAFTDSINVDTVIVVEKP